jgi:hypothetical protein
MAFKSNLKTVGFLRVQTENSLHEGSIYTSYSINVSYTKRKGIAFNQIHVPATDLFQADCTETTR